MSDLPELVETELNGLSLSMSFTAEYRLFPPPQVTEADGLVVSVYDGPRSSEQLDRESWLYTDICFVVFQKKLDAGAADQIAQAQAVKTLGREVENYFEDLREGDELGGEYRFVNLDGSRLRFPFSAEELRLASVFSRVVGLVFESERAAGSA